MRGDTPLSMLQSQLGSIWISSKIADIVRENEIASGTKKSLLYKIIKDKVSLSKIIIRVRRHYTFLNEWGHFQ